MNRFSYIFFICFLLVVSCTKQVTDIVSSELVSERVPSSLEGQVIFSLGEGFPVSVDTGTKAQTVSESDLDAGFNVSCVKGTPGSDVSVWTSTLFEKVGNYWTGGKWWPNTDESYRFYAVYPSSYSISYASSGSTIAASNSNDVVVAYKESSTFNDVNELEFEHIFARIGDVTVVSDGGYDLSNISITIVPKVSGTYNLRTKAWSSVMNGSSTVLGASVGTVNRDLLLVPGTYEVTASWTASHGSYSENFSGMSLNVTLPVGKISNITFGLTGDGPTVNLSVSMSNWQSNIAMVIPSTEHAFTINSNGDQVIFSRGNLQAHISQQSGSYIFIADEWRFAENQWDYCNNSLAVGNWVDLFGFNGSGASETHYGLCSSTVTGEYTYYGSHWGEVIKTEWGSIPGVVSDIGSGWRGLTRDEFSFILSRSSRTGASIGGQNVCYTKMKIRSDVNGGVAGIVIFPDNYSGGTPDGVSWGENPGYVTNSWNTATCTSEGWTALEKSGCVFIPASGYRSGTSVYGAGNELWLYPCILNTSSTEWISYWSNSTGKIAYNSGSTNGYRYQGYSVRLVKDLE